VLRVKILRACVSVRGAARLQLVCTARACGRRRWNCEGVVLFCESIGDIDTTVTTSGQIVCSGPIGSGLGLSGRLPVADDFSRRIHMSRGANTARLRATLQQTLRCPEHRSSCLRRRTRQLEWQRSADLETADLDSCSVSKRATASSVSGRQAWRAPKANEWMVQRDVV
jgi:hypothetical protein